MYLPRKMEIQCQFIQKVKNVINEHFNLKICGVHRTGSHQIKYSKLVFKIKKDKKLTKQFGKSV